MKKKDRNFRTSIPTAPISKHIDNFLRIKSLSVTPITYRGYYRRLSKFYRYMNTDIVTEEVFQKFLVKIKQEVSSGQYNQYLRTLKQYVRFLAERNIIPSSDFVNSYSAVKRVVKREKHYYSDEDIENFLSEVLKRGFPRWLYWFIWFGFMFGLRPKEIALLDINDIDLDKNILIVRAEITKTKTGAKIPIPTKLRSKIKHLLSWRKLQESDSTRLFVNSRGEPITEDNLSNHRKALQEIDGKFRFYDMRYTAGWRVYKRTGDIYLTARLLRHVDINQTRVYLQIQEEEAFNQMRSSLEEVY